MKDSKNLYTRCFSEYKLSDEDLKKLQSELLEILVDIKTVCDKHQIDYMLCGGTMLGAIRHKGFIPWDDDVDIMMLRNEYNKFKAVFDEELSEKYVLAEPLSSPRYFSKMVKVFKKDTGITIWKCRNCGYIFVGEEAPKVCPCCLHPQSFFEVNAENY